MKSKQTTWEHLELNEFMREDVVIRIPAVNSHQGDAEVMANIAVDAVAEKLKTMEAPVLCVRTSHERKGGASNFACFFEGIASVKEMPFCIDWWWGPSGFSTIRVLLRVRELGLHELVYPPTANDQLFKV